MPAALTKAEPKEVDLVICGPEMERIYETILQIAETQVPVLIQGESGVGKDLVARMIHRATRSFQADDEMPDHVRIHKRTGFADPLGHATRVTQVRDLLRYDLSSY